jgi:hypothetical protein
MMPAVSASELLPLMALAAYKDAQVICVDEGCVILVAAAVREAA